MWCTAVTGIMVPSKISCFDKLIQNIREPFGEAEAIWILIICDFKTIQDGDESLIPCQAQTGTHGSECIAVALAVSSSILVFFFSFV